MKQIRTRQFSSRFFLLTLSAMCVWLSSCMQFSLTAGGNKNEESKQTKTYFGSLYNFWWSESPEEIMLQSIDSSSDSKTSSAIYQVSYASNILYTSASFLSLGLFVPVDVSWYLTKTESEEYTGPIRRKKTN